MSTNVVPLSRYRHRNWVAAAVVKLGGRDRAARIAKVMPETIDRWVFQGRVTQLGPALRLSLAAKVPVRRMARG